MAYGLIGIFNTPTKWGGIMANTPTKWGGIYLFGGVLLARIVINSYEDCCGILSLPASETNVGKLKSIERFGYNKKGICYSVWKEHTMLCRLKGKENFWGAVVNVVKANAFPIKIKELSKV
jgi:hypothetical protein